MFFKIFSVVDSFKEDFKSLCELVPFTIKYGTPSKKIINYIEDHLKSTKNQEYLSQSYFI